MAGPPPPVFTLRGHRAGVTALVHLPPSTLISGDEEGNIMAWDLSTFKRISILDKTCHSKILSLKIIKLTLKAKPAFVLVVQSREHGVHLVDCDSVLAGCHDILTTFLSCPTLFSRGDAIASDNTHDEAILAYPSYLESHMVTVRFIGLDAAISISGSASRNDNTAAVFDILIKKKCDSHTYRLFVAYEDGCVVIYNLDRDCTVKVPELGVEGLKMSSVETLDLNIGGDFVSAFDVSRQTLVGGSPKKQILFINLQDKSRNLINLVKPGTSSISIRPDNKLFAAAGWDHCVRLFSIKSRKHLATFKNHQKQVSTILFIVKHIDGDGDGDGATDNDGRVKHSDQLVKATRYRMCCASLDGTISIFDVY